MKRCEDYPCCGHPLGECPQFDENGKELCWDCEERPIVKHGRCIECLPIWQQRMQYEDD